MYSNDQDLHWSNVTLMTYKDSLYGTDGFLRLSLSTSTSNFKDFNQPKLNLMISNNFSIPTQLDSMARKGVRSSCAILAAIAFVAKIVSSFAFSLIFAFSSSF